MAAGAGDVIKEKVELSGTASADAAEVQLCYEQFGCVVDIEASPEGNIVLVYADEEGARDALAANGSVAVDGSVMEASVVVTGALVPKGKLDKNRIFVGGLPKDATDEAIREHFGRFGAIKEVDLLKNMVGNIRGFGYVTFKSSAGLQLAMHAIPNHQVCGKQVDVKYACVNPAPQKTVVNKTYGNNRGGWFDSKGKGTGKGNGKHEMSWSAACSKGPALDKGKGKGSPWDQGCGKAGDKSYGKAADKGYGKAGDHGYGKAGDTNWGGWGPPKGWVPYW